MRPIGLALEPAHRPDADQAVGQEGRLGAGQRRDTQLTNARRTDIFKIGGVLMAPFPTSTLRMCLVSIISDATGKDTVDWVEPYNVPVNCPADGAVLTDIPTSVLPAGQSVIMSMASYDYNSPLKIVMPNTITFRRTFYLRPRLSDSVLRVP